LPVSEEEALICATTGTGGTVGGNTVRADMIRQFNELRQQLDRTAEDASFNGINLLRGDALSITFNETGSSSVTIQTKGGLPINSTNLGIDAQLTSVADTDAGLDTVLADLSTALGSLRSQSSAFGSNLSMVQNRQDFTKSMMNTLKGGADNLVLADQNEEGANLLALNTRAQLATSALSFASQGDQQVLQFLR
jgi:flagellin